MQNVGFLMTRLIFFECYMQLFCVSKSDPICEKHRRQNKNTNRSKCNGPSMFKMSEAEEINFKFINCNEGAKLFNDTCSTLMYLYT